MILRLTKQSSCVVDMSGLKYLAFFLTSEDSNLFETDCVVPSQAVCTASVHKDLSLCNRIHTFPTLGPALHLQQKGRKGRMNTGCRCSGRESPNAGKTLSGT